MKIQGVSKDEGHKLLNEHTDGGLYCVVLVREDGTISICTDVAQKDIFNFLRDLSDILREETEDHCRRN